MNSFTNFTISIISAKALGYLGKYIDNAFKKKIFELREKLYSISIVGQIFRMKMQKFESKNFLSKLIDT